MTLQVHAWAGSDPGQKRSSNEDGFLADTALGLFMVCDGMGGHAAGETASSEALKEIHRFLEQHLPELQQLEQSGKEARPKVLRLLEQAVLSACHHLYALAVANPRLRGMGTTVSLLLCRDRWAYLAHVGDSRIYLVRGEQMHQLTEDHTVLAELMRRSRTEAESIKELPYRHSLSRAVGTQSTVEVDAVELELFSGDRFLLCTDGLTEYVEEPVQLQAILTEGPLEGAPRRLIAHANARGGRDNVTAMVLEVAELELKDDGLATEVMQHKFRMDTLGAIWLLKHLSYKELIRVLNITESRQYPPGATIISEGEQGDSLFVMMRGQARVLKGREQVALLNKGDHFGEMALVDSFPRSATVEAVTQVQTRTISREPFYELLRSDPLLSNKILWNFVQILSCRLRDTSMRMEWMRSQVQQQRSGTPEGEEARQASPAGAASASSPEAPATPDASDW
ncbi:MAG: cyclic nucleotide-binding domain-containing protein [Deltaproteobacteria bacterium]|nr:cyclic nucleotide-binding domain-containing protein [Deltaproteobacteria bacterium]